MPVPDEGAEVVLALDEADEEAEPDAVGDVVPEPPSPPHAASSNMDKAAKTAASGSRNFAAGMHYR